MSPPGRTGKQSFIRRRYLLDRSSQVSVTLHLVSVLAGIGCLYAVAVYVLLGSDMMSGKTTAEMRGVLLGVQLAYFVVGGAILVLTALLLTHRYVGPAHVMRLAIRAMRAADYRPRLNVRRRDYHKSLTRELAVLGDELAAREAERMSLLKDLERSLDAGDDAAARVILQRLLGGAGARPAAREGATPVTDTAGCQ